MLPRRDRDRADRLRARLLGPARHRPFAGSANLLLHVARALSAPARGLDLDPAVWARTDANLRILGAPATVRLWSRCGSGPRPDPCSR